MRLRLLPMALALVALCFGAPPAQGAALSGRVFVDRNGNGVYDLGEPCVQSVVSLLPAGGGAEQTAMAECGQKPGYLFEGLPLGDYIVAVKETIPPDYIPSKNQPSKRVAITDEKTFQLDLPVYPRAGTIHGRVFEDRHGNGIYDAGDSCVQSVVSLRPAAGGTERTATVDCQYGVYVFRSVEPGDYLLSVKETTPPDYGGPSAKVTLPPGGVIQQDLPLRRPAIAGTITTKDDHPLADVVLLLHDESGSTVAVTITDPTGQYRFEALELGVYRVIAADPPGSVDGDALPGSHAVKIDRTTLEVTIVPGVTQYVRNDFTKILSQAPSPRIDRLLAVGDSLPVTGQLGFSGLTPVDLDPGDSTIRRLTDEGSLFVLDPGGAALLRLGAGKSEIMLDTTAHDPMDGVSLTRLLRVETGRDGISAILALRANNSRGIYRLDQGGLTQLAILPDTAGPAELAISNGGQVAFVAPNASGALALFQASGKQPVELLRQGQALVNGATIVAFSDLTANDAGDLALLVQLRRTAASGGVSESVALYRKTSAGPGLVAMSGDMVKPGRGASDTEQLLGMVRPQIGPDGTVVFGGWGRDFRNFYVAQPARSVEAVLPPGPWSLIASDFDYAVAADGAVGVRTFTSGPGGAALYLAASNGEVRLVAGGGQQFLEPVGQPVFGPGGQLFFQARNPVWPRDRNGRIPVGLFQYRWGDPGPVGVAVLDQVVPGEPGQRLLDIPQRPAVSAKEVAFAALFGEKDDRFPVPTAGLFRVPLNGTLEKDGILVVAEGDELSFPAQVVGFHDFYYTADGTLVFDTLIRRWLVVGQLVATLKPRASTASVVRAQAAPADTPVPLLTKGDDLGSGRKLRRVLGRLVPLGPNRNLFAAEFSLGAGAGEGLFTVDPSKQVQPVAVTDDPAVGPGLSAARFIGFGDTAAYTLSPPSVSADGNVVFKALLDRAGATTFGVFQWTSGAATAVGVTQPDPDLLKLTADDRPPYRLERWAAGVSGRAYFLEQHTTVFGATVTRLFGRSTAGPVPLVVPGATPVVGSSVPLDRLIDFVVNRFGEVLINGATPAGPAILAIGPTGLMPLTPAVSKDQPIPPEANGTTHPGLVFDGNFVLYPTETPGGYLGFVADLRKSGEKAASSSGFFRRNLQGVVETVLVTDLSGGHSSISTNAVHIASAADRHRGLPLSTLALSPNQQEVDEPIAFAARSSDGGWAIYRSRVLLDPNTGKKSISIALVAHEGQRLSDGSRFVSLDPSVLLHLVPGSGPLFRLNAAGDVVFLATDGQHWGIYRFSDTGP